MSNYYFMVEDTKKTGVPVDLDGAIQDRFIPKEEYIMNGSLPPVQDSNPWRLGRLNTSEIPDRLYLINLHRKIDFDLYKKNGGFVFSENFKKIFDSVEHPEYIATSLQVVNRDGEKNTAKEYYYVVIKEDCQAIDFEKSQFKQINMPDGRFGIRFQSILKYGPKLVLDTQLFHPNDIFFINQPYLKNYLLCNESTKQKIIESKIKTIQFVEIEKFVQYFNETHRLISDFKQMKLIIE